MNVLKELNAGVETQGNANLGRSSLQELDDLFNSISFDEGSGERENILETVLDPNDDEEEESEEIDNNTEEETVCDGCGSDCNCIDLDNNECECEHDCSCPDLQLFLNSDDVIISESILQKAVISTPMDPKAGKFNADAVPIGASIWLTVSNPESPLHGRHILITKRPDNLFVLTGGGGQKKDIEIEARRHIVLTGTPKKTRRDEE